MIRRICIVTQVVETEITEETLSRAERSDIMYYHARPEAPKSKVKLVFVHGAFSGGWIWTPFFLPYFAERGIESYALDLRGRTTSTPFMPTGHGLFDYVRDVQDLVDHIDGPCVLVGHSLGGMIVQKVSAITAPAGLALLASVPPEGLAVSAWQMALSNPLLFWNTAAFAMSPQLSDISVARDALLSPDVSDDISREVLKRLAPEAPRALMEAQMPLAVSAGFLKDTPVCVMGGTTDKLISLSAMQRTGLFYGVETQMFDDIAHSVMVDTRWRLVADAMHGWLENDVL